MYAKSINDNKSLKIEHTNLAEKVYRRIIDAILEGTFSAGERLVCNDIAKHFGVSRTPVREALVRLEKEGFIHSVPRSGTYVNSFTPEELKEIYEIREVLEGVAARMAAISPDSDLLEKMRQTCEDYKLGIEQKNVNLCVESDLLFHKLLVKASDSKRLAGMLEGFHIQSISIAKRGASYWTYAPTYLDEHCSVLDLISQRKGRLAEKKIREHIRKGKERTLK
ncbi:MAG: GntR family transcriptional regulator [Candidatus Bathyarchaeota archaeon]|nr:GntR family transcriptional regulator [Candidatus Bathyarchaeota archaeon]